MLTWVLQRGLRVKATYFSVTPKDFGSPKAKATAYFGVYKEEVPAELPHDVVIDEALLTSADAGGACVDLTLRTYVSFDEPIDRLEPECEIDGEFADVHVEEVERTQKDYQFVGTFDRTKVSAMGKAGVFNYRQSEQRSAVFSVIERRANVCCKGAIPAQRQSVVLLLKNKRMRMKETVAFLVAP